MRAQQPINRQGAKPPRARERPWPQAYDLIVIGEGIAGLDVRANERRVRGTQGCDIRSQPFGWWS